MIPKIIHIILGPTKNPIIGRCVSSWDVLIEKGFRILHWNDESIMPFILKHYEFAYQAILNARNHAEASDIARYAIVHYYGGYYVDWDVQLLSVEKFLDLNNKNKNGFLLQDSVNKTLASEAFSAKKRDKFLFVLIQSIIAIYENGFRDSMHTPNYSGPYRMRDSYYLLQHDKKQAVLEVKSVFLYDYSEIRIRPHRPINVAMIHYWVHSWIAKPKINLI